MSEEPNSKDRDEPPAEKEEAEGGPSTSHRAAAEEAEGGPSTSHRAAAEAAEEAFFSPTSDRASAGGIEDDEVDPELLALPRPRRRRNPIIGLAVVVLSIYMMYYLRRDLLFYFQPSEPADVGEVADVVKGGRLDDNAFVSVRGVPDRKHALILEGGGAFSRYESFFRLQQSRNLIFVRRHRKKRSIDREVDYVHTGRVVRFSSVPLMKKIREHYGRTMTSAHDLPFDRVVEAKRRGAGPVTVEDRGGERVKIEPGTVVWINVSYPGEWVIQFPRRLYAKVEVVREQLTKRLADLELPFARDDEPSRMFWRYVIVADERKVAAVRERFKDRALGVSVVRRQVSYTAKWKQLRISADTLTIEASDPSFPARFVRQQPAADGKAKLRPVRESPVKVGKPSVLYLTVSSKFTIPDEAVVIVTRERPGDYWYYLLLYLVLGAFVVINSWTLASRLRGYLRARRAESS